MIVCVWTCCTCFPVVPSSNRTKMRNIKLFGLWIKQKLLLPHIQNQPTNQPHNHHHLPPPPLLLLKSSSTTAGWCYQIKIHNLACDDDLSLYDWLNDGCISMHILNVVCCCCCQCRNEIENYVMIWYDDDDDSRSIHVIVISIHQILMLLCVSKKKNQFFNCCLLLLFLFLL